LAVTRDGGSRGIGGSPLGIFSKERPDDSSSDGLLANLVQLGNLLRSSPDLPGVVRSIATGAARTFGFNEVTVYLSASGDDHFRAHAVVGHDEARDQTILDTPVPASAFAALMQERYQIGCAFFVDQREHRYTPEERALFPLAEPSPDAPEQRPPRGWQIGDKLLVPLRDRANRIIGVLDLADPADGAQPTLDLAKELEVFSAFAAAAVESARQYEELERTTDLLEQQLKVRHELLDVSATLLSTLDHTAVFAQIADVLKMLVDYETIDIALVDESANELVTIFAQDKWAKEMMLFRQPLDHGVGGWVVRHDEPQLVNDMTHDPRGVLVPGTDLEPQASILVPLRFMGAVIGLLAVDRLAGRTFDTRELEIVQLFANLAAIAIRNARSYKEMEVQASTDGLTGLFNHRRFQEALAHEVARAERYGVGFCLLMMDLDRFKSVNDSVGHQRGDEVLRDVAEVLRSCSRESDFAARYGGEEFAMILPHADIDEARRVAERIRGQVADLSAVEPGLTVTISVGIAAFPDHADDTDGILGAADAALLSAKARGRNCVYTSGDDGSAATLVGQTPLAGLARRFATRAGFSTQETDALAAAVQAFETAGTATGLRVVGSGSAGDALAPPTPPVDHLFAALLYGTERWDGAGYPEGLRGESIPRVARAFAVLRAYVRDSAGGGASLRAESGRRFDPRMVNRFLAFLGEEASRWNPLNGVADGRG
jgi:diguanylate cyclase (GGDEF)-like protein